MNTDTVRFRLVSSALAGLLVLSNANTNVSAATITQDFSSDPLTQGWQIVGDASLFQWHAGNQNLEVTWDSSKTNSYFHHPLGTILAKDDDFSLAFDLRMNDIATDPTKPGTFQLAIGFINRSDAFRPDFIRGTGFESPNLVEFDYFPDSGFGATISPTMISTSHQFAYSFNVLELTTNDLFHVEMTYTATNQTLVTVITKNGDPFGPIGNAVIGETFGDFRADAVAVSSYSDWGQDPMWAGGILAHGVVDNLSVTVPEPPVLEFAGTPVGIAWEGSFVGRTNWLYTLERTLDFELWSEASIAAAGVSGVNLLTDPDAPTERAFYRVRAERP